MGYIQGILGIQTIAHIGFVSGLGLTEPVPFNGPKLARAL